MTDRRPATPIPRLASDTRRSWLAVTLAYVPILLYAAFNAVTGVSGERSTNTYVIGFASWFFFGLFFLVLTARTFGHVDAPTLATWLQRSTPRSRSSRLWRTLSGGKGTSWATQCAIVAVLVVLTLSFTSTGRSSVPVMVAAIAAIVGSWILILTAFTIEYARTDAASHGLTFPGAEQPVFADYLYFAVQVSTTFSGADVDVTTAELRRLVTWHSLIAFAFNTVIIAILVSALLAA